MISENKKLRKTNWVDSVDDSKCPECGVEYSSLELANDRNLDFEGAFFLANPGSFYCNNCGKKLTVEIEWTWRIVEVK
jgi:hypothetical protein